MMKLQNKFRQTSEYHEIKMTKMHDKFAQTSLQKINQSLNKKYLSVSVDKVFGQYVHVAMHLYHLKTNNGDKVTVAMSVYGDDIQSCNCFTNFVHPGYMNPNIVQKKIREMDQWPSCGAYGRCDPECMGEARNLIENNIEEINQRLGWKQPSYKIVRAWWQCVQGTNYFFHLQSSEGRKATVHMYVPFDYEGNSWNQDQQKPQQKPEKKPEKNPDGEEEEGELKFQINMCEKGHLNL